MKVASIPQTNGFTHITMNTGMAPFDNVKVRQAIAAALPYEDMFKAAIFGRGAKLFGADWQGTPPDSGFPAGHAVQDRPGARQAAAGGGRHAQRVQHHLRHQRRAVRAPRNRWRRW